jgi:hypothetical protein
VSPEKDSLLDPPYQSRKKILPDRCLVSQNSIYLPNRFITNVEKCGQKDHSIVALNKLSAVQCNYQVHHLMRRQMKNTTKSSLMVFASVILASAAFAGTCGTAKKPTVVNRSSTTCQTNSLGLKYCLDESWVNGGCASPFNNSINCTEAPPTKPISINIYRPDTAGGGCACVLQSTNTPAGQMKGIMGGSCN